MNIEQTNQLILLILNSILMTMLSAGLLGGVWLRQSSLFEQMSQVQRRYRQLVHYSEQVSVVVDKAQLKGALKRVRGDRQRLNNQYLWSRLGLLLLHGALLIFGMSLLALALRSLFTFDELIAAALVLFTVGAGVLLVGMGCLLADFSQGTHNGDFLGHVPSKVVVQMAKQMRLKKSLSGGFWPSR